MKRIYQLILRAALILGPFYTLGCSAMFAPADRIQLEDQAAKLLHCQEVGREAGTYVAYDSCKKDSGL